MDKRFLTSAVAMTIFGTVAFGTTEVGDGSKEFTFVVPDFREIKLPDDRARILDLVATHGRLVARLQYELREAADPKKKAYIVTVLRGIHAVQSTESLIEVIDLNSPDVDGEIRALWSDYPAVQALVKFHAYGVESILQALPKETKPRRRRLMFDVIEQVEGAKIGAMVFDRRIEQIQKNTQRLPLKDQVPFLDEIKALKAAKAEFETQFPLPPQ